MKVRNGFVSNSSSSSFIVGLIEVSNKRTFLRWFKKLCLKHKFFVDMEKIIWHEGDWCSNVDVVFPLSDKILHEDFKHINIKIRDKSCLLDFLGRNDDNLRIANDSRGSYDKLHMVNIISMNNTRDIPKQEDFLLKHIDGYYDECSKIALSNDPNTLIVTINHYFNDGDEYYCKKIENTNKTVYDYDLEEKDLPEWAQELLKLKKNENGIGSISINYGAGRNG